MASLVKLVQYPKGGLWFKIEATVWWFWLGVAHFSTVWPVTDPMNKISTILTCNLTSIVSCPVC